MYFHLTKEDNVFINDKLANVVDKLANVISIDKVITLGYHKYLIVVSEHEDPIKLRIYADYIDDAIKDSELNIHLLQF